MNSIDDFDFVRIASIPETTPEEAAGRLTQYESALVSANLDFASIGVANAGIAFIRARLPGAESTGVIIGARPFLPMLGDRVDSRRYAVSYPPGGTAETLGRQEFLQEFSQLRYWTSCDGATHLKNPDRQPMAATGLSNFDRLTATIRDSFAWIVLARPLTLGEIDDQISRLAMRMPVLKQRENSYHHVLELRRAELLHAELMQGRFSGMWEVRVAVGTAEASSLTRIAATLCGAALVDEPGTALLPTAAHGPLQDVLQRQSAADNGATCPFITSARTLARITATPNKAILGLRTTATHNFGVNEARWQDTKGFDLGRILGESYLDAGTLNIPVDILRRNILISGASGSGKTVSSIQLLAGLAASGTALPFLIISAKSRDYADVDALTSGRDLHVVRPGEPVGSLALNPFQPPSGYPLAKHVEQLLPLLLMMAGSGVPPVLVRRAMQQAYAACGLNLAKSGYHTAGIDKRDSKSIRYPTLADFIGSAKEIIDQSDSFERPGQLMQMEISARFKGLQLAPAGYMLSGESASAEQASVLGRDLILALDDIHSREHRMFVVYVVLLRLLEEAWVSGYGNLRQLVILEDADRVLGRHPENSSGAESGAAESMVEALRAARNNGIVSVFCTQQPSALMATAIATCDLKITHRLSDQDDREILARTMNLQTEELSILHTLARGDALIYSDQIVRPCLARINMPGLLHPSTGA